MADAFLCSDGGLKERKNRAGCAFLCEGAIVDRSLGKEQKVYINGQHYT